MGLNGQYGQLLCMPAWEGDDRYMYVCQWHVCTYCLAVVCICGGQDILELVVRDGNKRMHVRRHVNCASVYLAMIKFPAYQSTGYLGHMCNGRGVESSSTCSISRLTPSQSNSCSSQSSD